MGKLFGRHLYQPVGQLYCRRITALEEIIVVGQLLKLGINGGGNLRLAVTQAAAPESRHSIQKFCAIGIVDINMFSTINNSAGLFGITIEVSKGM